MDSLVSIIIINWNGWQDTIECLESLFKINYNSYNIIIVDNASKDDSVKKIEEFFCNIKKKKLKIVDLKKIHDQPLKSPFKKNDLILIKSDINYGFAKANNFAIIFVKKFIKPDYFLLLNNDTVVSNDFLINLIRIANDNSNFGILSPVIYDYYENYIQFSIEKIEWYTGRIIRKKINFNQNIVKSDTIAGASMLIKDEVINKIGLLPTEYFMLWEDIDYVTKAWRNQVYCGYVTKSKIFHKGSASIGNFTPMRIKYSMRNRPIFWRKYANNYIYLSFLIFWIIYHSPIAFLMGVILSRNKIKFAKCFFIGFFDGILFKQGK